MSDWLCPFPQILSESDEFLVALLVALNKTPNTEIEIPVLGTFHGTPEGTRTPNPRNRNPMLYPLSHWRSMFCAWIIIAQNREIARANFAKNSRSGLLFHAAADARKMGLVVFHRVLHIHHSKLGGGVADNHLSNSGVDDVPAAHGQQEVVSRSSSPVAASRPQRVQSCTNAFPAGGGDDSVGFWGWTGPSRTAHSVRRWGSPAVPGRSSPQLVAVDATSGCAVVAGGNDFVVADNDGAIVTAAAGGALQNRLGNIE